MEKIVNVYKPTGMTSYDVVRRVKRLMPGIKVGHAGTLDPFAEGVLLILIGEATKKMSQLLQLPKFYQAVLRLGESTASGDNTTPIIQTAPVPELDAASFQGVTTQFLGEYHQIPPAYSAKKINGQPAYRLARRGGQPELKPVVVKIYNLELQIIDARTISLAVQCSSGTYIRRLGEDLARTIGTVGHLVSLKRTAIGDYLAEEAISLSELPQALSRLPQGAFV